MSRLIYALSGEGRGHASRAIAVTAQLRRRGHEVRFCCGGTAQTLLERRGESVIPVPSLEYVLDENQLQLWPTARNIGSALAQSWDTIPRLNEVLADYDPALLIADFEPFSTRAAEWSGVPVLSLTHPQIVAEATYSVPPRHWLAATTARLGARFVTPWRPIHVLITSFYDPPLKRPTRTTVVPPILRSDVRSLTPTTEDHVLVYYNHGEGSSNVLQALKATRQKAIIYGFPDDLVPEQDAHLNSRPPSREGFLEDLATCQAVITTAGFTLMSEALYLGKPILVVPNGGIFEQMLNARFLEQLNLGEYAAQEDLDAEHIRGFLSRAEQYRSPSSEQVDCGTEAAVNHIEAIMKDVTSKSTVA